jgi:oligopeptide/dipeptide ABC transporter ATP-binding protein
MTDLLAVEDLSVQLTIRHKLETVLYGSSFAIGAGESLGVVGESGSGKSMTARAITRNLPPGAQMSGKVTFDGADVTSMRGSALREFYSRSVGFIFQDPRSHINPVYTIGDFLTESLTSTAGMSKSAAVDLAVKSLEEVGIADASRRLTQYPHQLSGGLLQRVMIAAALAPGPRLLVADEPTTALDVTTQADVMAILDEQRRERGMALIFITHNLELASAVCDRTLVMYAGRIVEERRSVDLHDAPLHPYSAALARSRPSIDGRLERLAVVPGRPISPLDAPPGCAFNPRCAHALPVCTEQLPELEPLMGGRVACHRAAEIHEEIAGIRYEGLSS